MKGIFNHQFTHETVGQRSPEQDLWITVLSKAAHDAIYCTDRRESRLAISWFKTGGHNFRKVCEYAGREPAYVHRVMQLPIQRREKEMKDKYPWLKH